MYRFTNSVIIAGFNGLGSVSFGITAWIFELTGGFFGMWCDLFTSFSTASLAVGKALQVVLFDTDHSSTA